MASLSYAQRRRVVFLTNGVSYGGAEKHLIQFLSRLDDLDLEVIIVCGEKDVITEHLPNTLRNTIQVVAQNTTLSAISWYRFFRTLHSDVAVFIHGWILSFPWYAYVAAKAAGVSRLYAVHHGTSPRLSVPAVAGTSLGARLRRIAGWRSRYVFRFKLQGMVTNVAVCVSDATRRILTQEHGHPQKNAVVIHNGVDLSEFSPVEERGSLRKDLGIAADLPILICVSRLSNEKGIPVLLEALSSLRLDNYVFRCLVAGDGPLETAISKSIKELELTSYVHLLGFQKDVRPYLRQADIFVLPSFSEGLPLSVLEAMACGLPCIVTDVGGNSEAVSNGAEGLVVAAGSAKELSRAIASLLNNGRMRQEMASRAQTRVRQCFDLEKSMKQLRQVLFN